MKTIAFVTSNKNKVKEVEDILGIKLAWRDIDVDEIQDMDLLKIVEHKAKQAYSVINKPVIVEDVGFYIDDWGGFPGPFIKWLHGTMGYDVFPKRISKSNRKAVWKIMYGYYDGRKFYSFLGSLKGSIANHQKGNNGWGFDVIFVPVGHTQTLAQMGEEEKNKISARKKALMKLKKFLRSL
jgi:non-canonical purine NTP pyrophosphatase (RdgB/HAM1 family)|tara:strand:+ start:70 stop:612 length:543 start_codon:yes stop_codon:yes gene_type:complete